MKVFILASVLCMLFAAGHSAPGEVPETLAEEQPVPDDTVEVNNVVEPILLTAEAAGPEVQNAPAAVEQTEEVANDDTAPAEEVPETLPKEQPASADNTVEVNSVVGPELLKDKSADTEVQNALAAVRSQTLSAVRLVGGRSRCEGRVEVLYQGTWGTVCDDGWDLNDAQVVCRMMGCGLAVSATNSSVFGQGTGQIWMDNVACSGRETSLASCPHNGYGVHNCGHHEDAGVVCQEAALSVRLIGGQSLCQGRVELFYGGSWGTVCDDGWDMNDANVVCRMVGCGSAVSAPIGARFGQGVGQIWMDDVTCSGRETSLASCRHPGYGRHNCGHNEDAGVVCQDPTACPTGWTSLGSRCYRVISSRRTWTSAESYCASQNGHLASVTSPEEYNYVRRLTLNSGYSQYWIGGFYFGGSWRWTDGSRFTYSNWASHHSGSTNPCIYHRQAGGWINTNCAHTFPFICVRKQGF